MHTEVVSNSKPDGINWASAVAFTILHCGAIAAPFFFTWPAFLAFLTLYWISLSFGIGMGYHRLLTHRSYQVPKAIEYVLAVCGALALEGGPIAWTSTHRTHHHFADEAGDPHTPRDGKWWSHIVWMLLGEGSNGNIKAYVRYAPDLMKDPFHRWLDKYHYAPLVTSGVLLYVCGGLPFLFWGVFVRVTLGYHVTWMVNSVTHLWGSRRFATRDDSRNNTLVALMSFGEGWHNNHHAHPTSARHGLAWYELDITWMTIWLLRQCRVAKFVRVAPSGAASEVEQHLA